MYLKYFINIYNSGQQPGIPAQFPGLPQIPNLQGISTTQIPNLQPNLNGIPTTAAQQSLQLALAQNPHSLSNPQNLLGNPQLLGNPGLFKPSINGHQPHGLFPKQIHLYKYTYTLALMFCSKHKC